MNESQRILKNVFAGGVGNMIGGALQFAAMVLLARKLGVSNFGTYSLLATMAFLLNRFADLGTSSILVRDLAVDPAGTAERLSSALSLAWLLVVMFSLAFTGCVHFVSKREELQVATVLMAISGLLQFPCACYGAVMRAREDNELEVLAFVLHKVALLLLLWLAVECGLGLEGVAIVYLLCAMFQCMFARWIVRRRYARPRWRFDLSEWKYLLKESAPFGLAAGVRLIGEQADVTILAWIAGMSAVGLYSAVYRITIGIRFVPQAMVIGLFPAYSRSGSRFVCSNSERSEFQRMYEFGVRAFTLIGVPFAVIIFFVAKSVIAILLGPRYLGAAPALQILAIAAGVTFAASPFPYLLTALNEQRFLLISSIGATILRIASAVALSWMFGIVGTSWAVLISEGTLLCIWVFYLASKQFTLDSRTMISKAALAGLAMTPLICLNRGNAVAPLLAVVVLSTGLYILMVFKLKMFSAEELQLASGGLKFMKPFVAQWFQRARTHV